MAQTIQLKRSNQAGNEPNEGQLALGEVAINTKDGKMFIKKSDEAETPNEEIVEIGKIAKGLDAPTDEVITIGDNNELSISVADAGSGTVNSTIAETGDGNLIISGTHLALTSPANESYLVASENQSVALFHDNVQKLITSGTGISVDGKVECDEVITDSLGINTSNPSVACDVLYTKSSDDNAGLKVYAESTSYDGKVITWGETTGERGALGWADGYGLDSCYIACGIAGLRFQREFGSSPRVVPCDSAGVKKDNSIDLGQSNARFDDIYATNTSIISSSDSTLKQDIETLTDAEERVAVACKGLLRKFRWRDAVEEKGDEARIHFGIMAQDLRDAFTAEGLDAGRYGMFISDTWWEHEGKEYPTADSAPEGATELTRLGVRYSELLAFIVSSL